MDHLYEPVEYTIKLGGKNTRGFIIKYIQNLLCNDENSITKLIIDDINCFHNASLIIDDIQDKSEMRRGQLCAYKVYGSAFTINAGYLQCFNLINGLKKRYPKEISNEVKNYFLNALETIHIGQGNDLYWTKEKIIPSKQDYYMMIDNKTGILFKLIGQLCLLSVNNIYTFTNEYKKNVLYLLQLMGRFFQIRDDYINITSPVYWRSKVFCEDFDEKKVSYFFVQHKEITNNDDLYQELISKKNITKKDKLYFYEKMYNNNILHRGYIDLNNYKNEIIAIEKKITQKEKMSEFLEMFFKKLEFNAPLHIKNVKLIMNII